MVKSASSELMDRMEIRFLEEQRKRDLSIAWGYAFAEKRSETSFAKLSEQADRLMYDRKKEMHSDTSPHDQLQS